MNKLNMNYQIGDQVICVSNMVTEDYLLNLGMVKHTRLIVGKSYKIGDIFGKYVVVYYNSDLSGCYPISCFKSLNDIRKEKLNKLYSV